jgi:GDPmannose 4,6-dehydratase
MAKTALITGVTGQDGAYLAEFLLRKGYEFDTSKPDGTLLDVSRLNVKGWQAPTTLQVGLGQAYADLSA